MLDFVWCAHIYLRCLKFSRNTYSCVLYSPVASNGMNSTHLAKSTMTFILFTCHALSAMDLFFSFFRSAC